MPEQLKSRTTFPDLPEGTVTFLFTDIEGSTQLLDRLRDQYATLLTDQRNILRDAFTKWNGSEIDTQGDAFFVAFPRATEAVSAVVDIQRTLATHTCPQSGSIRIQPRSPSLLVLSLPAFLRTPSVFPWLTSAF